jgi:hypothetical protein
MEVEKACSKLSLCILLHQFRRGKLMVIGVRPMLVFFTLQQLR